MSGLIVMVGVFGVIVTLALHAPLRGPAGRSVTRTHRGLEMKARNGRLVYVRQTESEREI